MPMCGDRLFLIRIITDKVLQRSLGFTTKMRLCSKSSGILRSKSFVQLFTDNRIGEKRPFGEENDAFKIFGIIGGNMTKNHRPSLML